MRNKKILKKVEKVLKYELRKCKVGVIDKITEDLEDVARQIIGK